MMVTTMLIELIVQGLLEAFVVVAGVMVLRQALPWLAEKNIGEQVRTAVSIHSAKSAIYDTLVESAEQQFGAGEGDAKHQYVTGHLIRKGITVDEYNLASAVYRLNERKRSCPQFGPLTVNVGDLLDFDDADVTEIVKESKAVPAKKSKAAKQPTPAKVLKMRGPEEAKTDSQSETETGAETSPAT